MEAQVLVGDLTGTDGWDVGGAGWHLLPGPLVALSDPGSGTSTIGKPEGRLTSFSFSSFFSPLSVFESGQGSEFILQHLTFVSHSQTFWTPKFCSHRGPHGRELEQLERQTPAPLSSVDHFSFSPVILP